MTKSSAPQPQPEFEFEAAYLALHRSGELVNRAHLAALRMHDCDLCARYCHVDREESGPVVDCGEG